MTDVNISLAKRVENVCGERAALVDSRVGEVTIEVSAGDMTAVLTELRDNPSLRFEMLVDLCGVDYLTYGEDEWRSEASGTGFGRGVARDISESEARDRRFCVVYHLLSISGNERMRVRVFCPDNDFPRVDSVVGIWASANWYEREAFDLFGILFDGHPDLRRLLTDYGFVGHPFRKDFPLTGEVEMIYDPDQQRVVYQEVSIEPRTLVPRVIRHDNRYDPMLGGAEAKETPDA